MSTNSKNNFPSFHQSVATRLEPGFRICEYLRSLGQFKLWRFARSAPNSHWIRKSWPFTNQRPLNFILIGISWRPYLEFFCFRLSRIRTKYGIYSVNHRIQSECGKIRTRKSPNMDCVQKHVKILEHAGIYLWVLKMQGEIKLIRYLCKYSYNPNWHFYDNTNK